MGTSDKMVQENWKKEYAYAGDFKTALMRTIECADTENMAKLKNEYPILVAAFRKFSTRREI